jgi:hypothetical protein
MMNANERSLSPISGVTSGGIFRDLPCRFGRVPFSSTWKVSPGLRLAGEVMIRVGRGERRWLKAMVFKGGSPFITEGHHLKD